MAQDFSKLSDAQLLSMIPAQRPTPAQAVGSIESGNAPDTSTITNPTTGAFGSMQVMPATGGDPGFGVRPSNGTPEDTARMGRDYLAALQHSFQDETLGAGAYNWGPGNMHKWLQSGGDLSKIPDETLKYMIKYNQIRGQAPQAPAQPSPDTGAPAGFGGTPTPDRHARIQQFFDQAKPGIISNGDAARGAAELGLNMATGFAGMAAGGLHSLYDLATGQSDQATADIARDEEMLTYKPRTALGQQYAQQAGEMFGAAQTGLEQGAVAAMGGIPFIGEDLQKNATAVEAAKTAADIVANLGPMMLGEGGIRAKTGAGKEVTPAAGELDKMGTPSEAPTEPLPGEFVGPVSPEEYARTNQGATTPFYPEGTREYLGTNQPQLRQMSFDFENEPLTHPDMMAATPSGEVMPADVLEANRQFRDPMQSRIDTMKTLDAQQLDIFHDEPPIAEPPRTEEGRSLSPQEFEQTLQDLAQKDGARFPLPEDMEGAYTRYQDIVRDDQGQLFDLPKMAENFAREAVQESIDRRLDDHPTVKANQAKVDQLEALLTGGTDQMTRTGALSQLQAARELLQKSRDNIAKQMDPAARAAQPFVKDGVVHMYTFGHMPELMRSIGALLKGVHGMIFRTLDRMIPSFKNLDSGWKIAGQGIKDFVNKEAKRDWSQTVNEKPREQLKQVPGLRKAIFEYNPYEAQEISPAELKQQMQSVPDISGGVSAKIANNIIQGGLQMTNLTHHPLIKYVTETVDRSMRNSKQYVRDMLTGPQGLRTKMHALSTDELTGIRMLMEMNEGKKEFTPNELRHKGYSQKQIDYYQQGLELNNQAFQKTNEARNAAGLAPLDRRTAHIAGYFLGDFRRIVTDASGKVVAVLSHNNRGALKTITNRFLETHPEGDKLTVGPIQLRKLRETEGPLDNRFQGYTEILNMMKENDPHMKAVVDAYQHYLTHDAINAMSDRAKYKSETGVLGAEGRKSWQSAQQNAVDGARMQLRYLEHLDKWSNMQQAIGRVQSYLTDPEINAPNAKALAQDYLDSVQGRNRGTVQKLMNAMLNGVAEATGLGPSTLKNLNNGTKSVLLAKFVGMFKLSHSAVTMLQPMQALPTLNARLAARGADLGMASINSVGKALNSSFGLFAENPKTAFDKAAQTYMKANGTADVGMSSHLENVTKGSAKSENIRHIAELNVRIPEQGARTFCFMYYAHMLKDLDPTLSQAEVFGTAHNLMRDAMVDYSPHERSLMFGKLGILGDIASTLTRFKYNQIGQHLVGWNDMIKQGHIAPLLTTVMTSAVAGGVRGVFAYEAANQAVDKISTWMAQANLIKQPTSLNELVLQGVHGIKNKFMADAINFGLPSAIGKVNMTGSITNADTIPTDPLGALFPTASEFKNLAESTGSFLIHPNKNTAEKAALQWMPNSAKGIAEDLFFTKNGNYMNPNTGKLEAHRGTTEEVQRALSFRPLEEGKEGLVANVESNKEQQLNTVKHTMVDRAFSDAISNGGHLTPDQFQRYAQRYIQLGADPNDFIKDYVEFAGMDQNRTRLQRAQGIPNNDLSSIYKYQRVEGMK